MMERARHHAWLALFGAFAGLASGTIAWKRALADERMLDAGAALLHYARAVSVEPRSVLTLNGASFGLLSGSTRDPISAVLDAFEARCTARGADFSAALEHLHPSRHALPREVRSAFRGVLRREGERAGYLACFELEPARPGPREWSERLRAFAVSADLAALGGLRFAWVLRGERDTSYVALWNRGRVPLASMFPRQGDAPGVDAAGVPRPAGRRILSAYQPGAAPLLVAYRVPGEPARALARYREQLGAQGFRVDGGRTPLARDGALVLWRGELTAAVSAAAAGDDEAVLAITPLR